MKTVKIYIATSIKSPKSRNGRVGFVVEKDPVEQVDAISGIAPVQHLTSNQSEMTALYKALFKVKEPSHLVIFTDSVYLKSSIERLQVWKAEDWKNSKGKDIANKSAWMVLEEKLRIQEVEFHIKEDHEYKKWLEFEVNREEAP